MSSIRGKRGQTFFRDLVSALEAMPEKRLIPEALIKDGEVCALGALGVKRGYADLKEIDPEDAERIAGTFGIAEPLARETAYQNDEYGDCEETPEQRWVRMHAWAKSQLKTETA